MLRRLGGNAHPNIVPYQAFPTADGRIILAVGNDGQFRRFCDTAGRPNLGTDPRYATNVERVRNRAELAPILEALLASRPFRPADRGLKTRLDHPLAGRLDLGEAEMVRLKDAGVV